MGESKLTSIAARLGRGDYKTEAEIQSAIDSFLEFGDFDLDDEDIRLEATTSSGGRIDIEIGRTVIETKRVLSTPRSVTAAEDQLLGYLVDRTSQTGERHVRGSD